MKDDKTAKIDAAVFALLKRGAQTRLDLMEAIDDLRTVDDADAACARLVRAGLASVTTLDGDPAHMLVFGAELPISGPKSEPPDTSAIDPAWPTGEGEEVRPIPDRRLLCRITPERRAQLNAEDAELSR